VKSGLRVFSEKYLVSFCKHLYKDQNKKTTDEKQDKNGEKDAFMRSFFHSMYLSLTLYHSSHAINMILIHHSPFTPSYASFHLELRKGEGIGDVLWLVPYSQEWVHWEDDHGMTPLHVAVDLKQPDLVKTCITKCADVNHKDGQGWYFSILLMFKSHSSHISC
jgi:hypothetical protein